MNKRKVRSVYVFAAVLVAAAAVCGGMALAHGTGETASSAEAGESGTVQEETAHSGYLICVENGEITVSGSGEKDVSSLGSEIDHESLRAADRELLKKGIHVEDYEQLLMLMEDFGS